MKNLDQFILPEGPGQGSCLVATYLLRSDAQDILTLAATMATEQTTGTWVSRSPRINVPILAHLDFGGALYASPRHGISSHLLYGKLARLTGVDLLTILTPYGKFALTHEKYMRIILGLRRPLRDKPHTFPIAGGAIKQGHLPQLFEDLGKDFIVGAGGAIYAHPMGATAGAGAFRQGIEVMMKHGRFAGAESELPELKAALDLWGTGVA